MCSLRFDIEKKPLSKLLLPFEIATPGGVYTQETVLLLEVSTPHGPELHLDLSTLQRHVLHREVYTPHGPELHLDDLECSDFYFFSHFEV